MFTSHGTGNQGSFQEHYTLKKHHETIAKAYLSNRECSIQKTVYHILAELNLRRIFLAMYFVNTNLPEERVGQ